MNDYIHGTSPVGRLVFGHIFQPTMTGYQNKPLAHPEWDAGVAIPKTSPGLKEMFDNLAAAAAADRIVAGQTRSPGFSWKYKDGDAPKYAGKEGWAGCFIFVFSSKFAPKSLVDTNFQQIIDPNMLKPGYQVRVGYSVTGNQNAEKPGVYLNLERIQLVAQDKVIVSGPSDAEVFGHPAQALPLQQGAMATPPQGPHMHQGPQAGPVNPMHQGPTNMPQAAPAWPAELTPNGQAPHQADPNFLHVPGMPR